MMKPFVALLFAALCAACGDDGNNADPDASTDADTDSDTDSDTDTDGGTDTDADTDGDAGTEFLCEGVLHFPDPVFERSVCWNLANLNIAEIYDDMSGTCTGDILAEDVAQITTFSSIASTLTFPEPEDQLSDLTGMQCMPLVEHVHLSNNNAAFDLSPLAGASALVQLDAPGNQIEGISPLADLAQLQYLALDYNAISDLSPLAGLTQLIRIELEHNVVSDVSPLSSLPNLVDLHLGENNISEIAPLSSLTSLQSLSLSFNGISDIDAVAGMSSLLYLYLQENSVTDLTPLVGNVSFAEGCMAWFGGNPIDCGEQAANIDALMSRGVQILCDCDSCYP
jgi:hypothetical protein